MRGARLPTPARVRVCSHASPPLRRSSTRVTSLTPNEDDSTGVWVPLGLAGGWGVGLALRCLDYAAVFQADGRIPLGIDDSFFHARRA